MPVRSLLIKPRKVGSRADYVSVNYEPLGLLSLAAFVRQYSQHSVSIIDAQAESGRIEVLSDGRVRMGMPDDELRRRIEAIRPQIVGISALFEMLEAEVLRVAAAVKSISPDILVIVGGLDAGVRYERYLRSGLIDLVVRGEGEETFLDILDCIDSGGRPIGIPGTCEISESGAARMNPARTPRVGFDEYAYPARDLLPLELYTAKRTQRAAFPFLGDYPALLLQGSRGCRLKCAFCDIVAVGRQWTAHSPEYVVDEIEHCIERYRMRTAVFVDDNFMMDREWALRICELIIERKLGIALDILSGIAVWTLSESMIDMLVAAGLQRVLLPIESGNPSTIRFIKKPVDLEKTRRMVDYCNRKGLYTCANLIIGFPYETRQDIQQTIDWGRSSGIDYISYFVAEPFVDAGMYSIYKDNGWISGGVAPEKSWRTAHFTREELDEIAREAGRDHTRNRVSFYLHGRNIARYLIPKIASPKKLRFAIQMGAYLLLDGHRVGMDLPASTPLAART